MNMFRKTVVCFFFLLKPSAAVEFTMGAAFYAAPFQAGSSITLTWTGASGPVKLLLDSNPPTNLQTVLTIASGLTVTSYVWTPSTSIPTGLYAFEIDDSTGPNYSEEFTIDGAAAASTTIPPSKSTSTPPAPTSSTLPTTSTTPSSILSSTLSSSLSSTLSSTSSTPNTSSSATPSSLSTVSSSTSTQQSTTSTPQPSHGLSTGAKAGIGVGATLGAIFFIAIVWFAFWYGRRSAAKNKKPTPDTDPARNAELETVEARTAGKPELETKANIAEMGGPLSEEEKNELERRRRAAELEGSSPVPPGVVSERAELEARRRGEIFEM